MTNGFEHPFHGARAEEAQAMKQLLEEIATDTAVADELKVDLRHFRTLLRSWTDPAQIGWVFALFGSERFWNSDRYMQDQTWNNMHAMYIHWKMANDDEFWTAMERGIEANPR
jgi:hypothetical protein